ncbi:MAG TPA: DUF4390 domain-containing protein [Gammaproteobacteria bacterium]|nr:DUF4390 domain-containing protein [Gammaproteobacteria bacterium]
MTKLSVFRVLLLMLGLSYLTVAVRADAPDLGVDRVALRLHQGIYHLDADLHVSLSREMTEALNNGVPLAFRLEFELYAPRTYLWDSQVARLGQEYVLNYHALSGRYLILNRNTEQQISYRSLDAALASLGHVKDLPVLDQALLKPGKRYLARIRIKLDDGALPVPLRVKTFFKRAWKAQSPWVELTLIRP